MTEADSAAYFIGRPVADLQDPYCAEDCAFGSVRLDGQHIKDGDFAHCTFANISFKEACIKDTRFLDCAFIGCYFRRAEIRSSHFIGCKFVDCNFSHIAIKSCDFKYSSFRRCQLPFSEILDCMPSEPNLREELARNLYLASSELGLSGDARRYRMEEIRARENSYRAAVAGRSSWYREHFDGFARVRVFFFANSEPLESLALGIWRTGPDFGLESRHFRVCRISTSVLRYARWSRKETTRYDHAV